ncbi:MAG: hypothetical protein ACYDHX_17430, partial [Methanothrix sp.]
TKALNLKFEPFITALTNFKTWVDKKLASMGLVSAGAPAGYEDPSKLYWKSDKPVPGTSLPSDARPGEFPEVTPAQKAEYDAKVAAKDTEDKSLILSGGEGFGSGNAAGITFTKTGFYAGKFHGPEETLSRAATIKGPGTIARALDALNNARASSAPAGGATEIHIHNQNDFSGMKVSSDIDVEALLRMIDKRIESISLETVKKSLGQRRT